MKSIRTRLTLFFLLICVGCLAIAMAVSSIFSRSALTDTNDRLHEQQAEYYASMIDSWLQENTGDVDAACTFLEAKSLIDEVTIRPVMEQYTNNNVNAINVNVGLKISCLLTVLAGNRKLDGTVREDRGIRMQKRQVERSILAILMWMQSLEN